MIFVVLAMAISCVSFFPYKIRPLSPSIRQAPRAYSRPGSVWAARQFIHTIYSRKTRTHSAVTSFFMVFPFTFYCSYIALFFIPHLLLKCFRCVLHFRLQQLLGAFQQTFPLYPESPPGTRSEDRPPGFLLCFPLPAFHP